MAKKGRTINENSTVVCALVRLYLFSQSSDFGHFAFGKVLIATVFSELRRSMRFRAMVAQVPGHFGYLRQGVRKDLIP